MNENLLRSIPTENVSEVSNSQRLVQPNDFLGKVSLIERLYKSVYERIKLTTGEDLKASGFYVGLVGIEAEVYQQ